jgi:hypothetical protein
VSTCLFNCARREKAGIHAAGPSALDVFDGAATRGAEDAVRTSPRFFRQVGDEKISGGRGCGGRGMGMRIMIHTLGWRHGCTKHRQPMHG